MYGDRQGGAAGKGFSRDHDRGGTGAIHTIFLGYPSWWATMPRPVCTFLKTYGFAGKNVAPFCTHGGSGLGDSINEIRALCPQANILKGLAVRGRNAASSKDAVQEWLRSLVF